MVAEAPGQFEPRGAGAPSQVRPIDVLVATYNSAQTLEETLTSVRAHIPVHCLIVVDRESTDGTPEIARRHQARLVRDSVGLGFARNAALQAADTDPVLFVDSDVCVVKAGFFAEAFAEFERPRTAAVVGASVGHAFRYGLPLGLTVVGREWALGAGIPDAVQSRETYYLQLEARRRKERVRYIPDAMVHRGTYRKDPHWPEFQGAAIRATSGWNPRELAYAAVVIQLMHMNSRRPKNVLYSPIFFGKLLRGFLAPTRWGRLERVPLPVTPPWTAGGPPRGDVER